MTHKQGVFNLYKQEGETPLECLTRLRMRRPELADAPLTYAGRLDPMAAGVLIALSGEERRRKEEYLVFDKEYEFEVLWGFASDTYDALGIVEFVAAPSGFDPAPIAERFLGSFDQEYPAYSSRTVGGRALHELAREGSLAAADIPKREAVVRRIAVTGARSIPVDEAHATIAGRIGKVTGDFRQAETLESWKRSLDAASSAGMKDLVLTKLSATVGSGTYIRSIAHGMGEVAGCGALAWSILRTKVGDFTLADSEGSVGP